MIAHRHHPKPPAPIGRSVPIGRIRPIIPIPTRSIAYAYYLTISPEGRALAIVQVTGSSGRQRVPTDALGGIKVPLPPLPEQKAIAAVLGVLDDKIELNRRTDTTLGAMARALFQSWLVDFDPVRRK